MLCQSQEGLRTTRAAAAALNDIGVARSPFLCSSQHHKYINGLDRWVESIVILTQNSEGNQLSIKSLQESNALAHVATGKG